MNVVRKLCSVSTISPLNSATWSEWGFWDYCSRTCDYGTMTRWRECLYEGEDRDEACSTLEGLETDTELCAEGPACSDIQGGNRDSLPW